MPFKFLPFILLFFITVSALGKDEIRVGCKRFTENYVIAEIISQYLESHNYPVQRRFGLGGTMVAFRALENQEIDVYPDYTGTIEEMLFGADSPNSNQIEKALEARGLTLLPSLGFSNNYVVVMEKTRAQELGIKKISDLKQHPDLIAGFSHEFQARHDGWKALARTYSLNNRVRGVEVPLTYQALNNGRLDFAEAYSTEPLLKTMDLIILEDDKGFFPDYQAAPLVHSAVDTSVQKLLSKLSGQLSTKAMMTLNARASDGVPIETVASDFLKKSSLLGESQNLSPPGFWGKMMSRTLTHLWLTGLAVFLATVLAIPLAVFSFSRPRISNTLLSFTGILQTIPSIALLAFMIPIFGIGFKPALFGLFIYSLLPILRNTHTAMKSIDPTLLVAAKGIGLSNRETFLSVQFPLAFPTILAGVRTATTLNIGTATLAAFIGAGGLGEPIVTGLALNDTNLLLQGAIPAAVLALFIDGLFAVVDRFFVRQV